MHTNYEPGLFRAWFTRGYSFELAWKLSDPWLGFGYRRNEEEWSFGLYVPPFRAHWSRDTASNLAQKSIAFKIDPQYLWLQWYVGSDEMNSMPWMFEWPWRRWHHVRHEWLGPERKYPYTYERQNGEVQRTTATVRVEEREWRWMHPKNLLRRRIKRYLDVSFSDEIGERTGSWKGGVLGCGVEMKRGEDEVAALRRMERERRFH